MSDTIQTRDEAMAGAKADNSFEDLFDAVPDGSLTPSGEPAQTSNGQATPSLLTSAQPAARTTEPVPHTTTGNVPQADLSKLPGNEPTSNGQPTVPGNPSTPTQATSTGALANQPAGQPAAGQPAIQALPFDPNVVYDIPGQGQRTLGEILGSALLKEKYDQQDIQLKQREKELEEKSRHIDSNGQFLQIAANNPIARAFLTNLASGVEQEAALKSAIATDPQLEQKLQARHTVEQIPTGPPRPGEDRYYDTPFQSLGLEFGSPEYDEWFRGGSNLDNRRRDEKLQQSFAQVIDQKLNPVIQQVQAIGQQDAQQKQLIEKQSQTFQRNDEVFRQQIPELVLRNFGADYRTLSESDRQQVGNAVMDVLVNQGIPKSKEGWSSRAVQPIEIAGAFAYADLSFLRNGQTQSAQPVPNGLQVLQNGTTGQLQQPMGLIRPEADNPTIPHSASPATSSTPPNHQGSFDNPGWQTATDEMFAGFHKR